jgi:hypothetical protein
MQGLEASTMQEQENTKGLVRQLAILTLVGFLVVTLSGPVLALLGVFLPFALIGAGVWVLFKAVTLGPRVAFGLATGLIRGIVQAVLFIPRQLFGAAGIVLTKTGSAARLVGGALAPLVIGAVVGGVLGAVGGVQNNDPEIRIPLGLALGAGVGVLIAATRTRPAREQVLTVQPVRALPQV